MTAINLSSRAKFSLTGADRLRYLNGQVTNDVSRAAADTALAACVTDAKGRLEGLVQIIVAPDGEAFWIDAHESLREDLHTRLDRYIIADDCELADITDDYQLWHVLGEERPGIEAVAIAKSTRLGPPGWDVWLSPESEADWEAAPPESADELRVEHLVPAWMAEAKPGFFPADLGLDRSAVDFHKGCYIGQEVVSRMKMSGKSNWILARLEFDSPPVPGMLVHPEGEDPEKDIGGITTVSGNRALAVLRRARAQSGTAITATDPEKPLSIGGDITKTV